MAYLGSEIVADGGFDTDVAEDTAGTYWITQPGWTVSNGSATYDGGGDSNKKLKTTDGAKLDTYIIKANKPFKQKVPQKITHILFLPGNMFNVADYLNELARISYKTGTTVKSYSYRGTDGSTGTVKSSISRVASESSTRISIFPNSMIKPFTRSTWVTFIFFDSHQPRANILPQTGYSEITAFALDLECTTRSDRVTQ